MNELADLSQLEASSLRTKQDYLRYSDERGLPSRCPIFPRCERRALTQSFTLEGSEAIERGWIVVEEPKVTQIEDASMAGGAWGEGNFYARHMCPEIALFDKGHTFLGLRGIPATEVGYDKYWPTNPYHILDTGHFSQCLEYLSASSAMSPPGLGPTDSRYKLFVAVRDNASAFATIAAAILALLVYLFGDAVLS